MKAAGAVEAEITWNWRRRLAISLTGLLCVVLLLRLTVGDRLPLASILFYGSPWPLITLGWWVAACLHRRGTRSRNLSALTGLACLVTTVGSLYEWNAPPATATKPTLEVLFWNTARGRNRGGWPVLFTELRSSRADVIALSESESKTIPDEQWSREFVDRQVYRLPGGLTWLTRTPAEVRSLKMAEGMIGVSELLVHQDGRTLRILLVDLAGAPWVARRPAWRQMAEYLRERSGEPTLLVGDFNTPDDSTLTELVSPYARPVFRSHGRGYAATWPLPCPVLTLDHAWATPALAVQDCQLGWSNLSDHRSITITLGDLPAVNP